MKHLPLKAVFVAVFCNILFGSALPMIKIGYAVCNIGNDVFSKILFAGIRFFVSGILVFFVDAFRQQKFPVVKKTNLFNVVLLAITYTFLQYIFMYVGVSNTSGSLGAIVSSSSAFIAVIVAHFIYPDDKLSLKKIIGSVLGFFGVMLACFARGGNENVSFWGEGFIFIGAIFFVIGSVINKKASQMNSSFTVTAYNLLLGGGLLIFTGVVGGKSEMTYNLQGILVLLYLSAVSSVGFTLWSILLRKYSIGELSVFNFIIPVSGAVFSGMLLKESNFNWKYILAFGLVSLGIITVNHKVDVSE